MKSIFRFLLISFLLSIVISKEIDTVPSETENNINNEVSNNVIKDEGVKKSFVQMMETLASEESKVQNTLLLNQIYIWVGICLCFILYFSCTALLDMSIAKSSILYAQNFTDDNQNQVQ